MIILRCKRMKIFLCIFFTIVGSIFADESSSNIDYIRSFIEEIKKDNIEIVFDNENNFNIKDFIYLKQTFEMSGEVNHLNAIKRNLLKVFNQFGSIVLVDDYNRYYYIVAEDDCKNQFMIILYKTKSGLKFDIYSVMSQMNLMAYLAFILTGIN